MIYNASKCSNVKLDCNIFNIYDFVVSTQHNIFSKHIKKIPIKNKIQYYEIIRYEKFCRYFVKCYSLIKNISD